MVLGQIAPPRVRSVPDADDYSWGDQAVELAAEAGLELDPWEADVLRVSLGQRSDGKWSAFENGVCVPRQNGKGAILEARSLAGLFLLPEQMIVHSAHQFDTSLEAFRRLLWLIEDNSRFEDEVRRVSRSHGDEGIELADGSRLRFRTRTKGGGRGFSADCLILDEAMLLPEYGYGALLPILSARENPQVWYTGSAVDKEVHPDGVVFARVRERGQSGQDPRLAYFEWSLPYERPEDVPERAFTDPEVWAQSNPALNIRISPEHVASEQRALDARTFAVERLGVGDWPDTTDGLHVISMELWGDLADAATEAPEPLCVTFDVSPDRSKSSVAFAGRREDGPVQSKVVKRAEGTGWVAPLVKQLVDEHRTVGKPRCDGRGPAASLVSELELLGVEVDAVNAGEMAQACGRFFDTVEQTAMRHSDDPELNSALKGAAQRPLGDAWAWSRKNSGVDITPLVSSTLAVSGVIEAGSSEGGFEW